MARARDINIFSTSFLDLLSCGMGAVIILLMVFLSRLRVEPQDATAFATIVFRVDYGDTELTPFREAWSVAGKQLLAIRPRVGDAKSPFEFAYRSDPAESGQGKEAFPSAARARAEAGVEIASRYQEGSGLGLVTIPNLSDACSGHKPAPPKGRRETSIVFRTWEGPQRVEYVLKRNGLPASSRHYYDESLMFKDAPPLNGRGWMSHDVDKELYHYAYPLRIKVVVYTTQSPEPLECDFKLHEDALPHSEFRIVIVLDPEAAPPANLVKEAATP